ncbi:MAG TPA: glycosyltransferase [Balneolaceae bacterium]
MPDKPLLSVAVIIRNQKDTVEATLTTLFELARLPFELFVIDDASTDGSDEVIESLLDYYGHEQTFYFRHEQTVGRANSLNEVLLHCSGSLFWAPERIQEIDEGLLIDITTQLQSSDYFALTQQQNLPNSPRKWVNFISQNSWFQDGDFIWNLPALSSNNAFFNPFAESHPGLELALRLENNFALTDEQWYKPVDFYDTFPDLSLRHEMLLSILRKYGHSQEIQEVLFDQLKELNHQKQDGQKPENNLLQRAEEMMQKGQFSSALELVEDVLRNESNHSKARQLKIELLEKKRRFVEASELKHEQKRGGHETSSTAGKPEVSIIIPTTGYGKGALEHCLVSISDHCDTSQFELIVIDNASLDDTHDYLDELKEKQFLNCKIITNKKNAGFAASVNQGMEAASGDYYCIMHNDIELNDDAIEQLKKAMESHSEFAVVGPATDNALNSDQNIRNFDGMTGELISAEYLDSFCMMVRADARLKMDEKYELAFFEDVDLCFQAGVAGHKVGIAPNVRVGHHLGTTTLALNLDTESEQYWKNAAYFNEKWDVNIFPEKEVDALNAFDQLLALDELVNPLFPEEEIKQHFEQLFTSELKTEILKTDHEPATLCRLVHLFMVMDEREVMRHLEDRLDNIELPASLIFQLVYFYFQRNIYSRCIHYLDQLNSQGNRLQADLYRLSIYTENKELEQAIPLLKDLLDHAPANPLLYKLAGEIHKFSGNEDEAGSFYDLAEQIDPFNFANEEKDAFGFEL